MGCGKSKHAVETATTIVKSTNTDGTKQTTVVKSTNSDGNKETTVTETGDSSVIQKEVETKSLFVEDTKEKIVTKVDPATVAGAKTDNVAATFANDVDKTAEESKEDVKVKDSQSTDASEAQTMVDNATSSEGNDEKVTKVVGKGEKVDHVRLEEEDRDVNPNIADNVVPTSSKDNVDIARAVKEDEEKMESTLKMENEALKKDEGKKESVVKVENEVQTNNEPSKEEEKMKEPDLTRDTKTEFMTPDTKTKTEFMTPTLSEEVVGPFEVAKDNGEVKDSKEENITTATLPEKPVKTINSSSNPTDDKLKVKENKPAELIVESTMMESKKEVKAADTDTDKAKISPAAETEKVLTASEANVAETQKKEP